MDYQQAMARIPQRILPDYWIGTVDDLECRWQTLQRGSVQTLATTPGGRPIHLITYGTCEPTQHRANFNSAIGGRDPSAYADKSRRDKPVLLFVGPVHGHETEGLTGLVNLVSVMEGGLDLRGRAWPELHTMGDQCRLLIIPSGNPDGTARFAPRSLHGLALDDIRFWGQGTWVDGTFCDWPQCKRQHPMTGDNVGFLGCYFDDAGINPMHDEFMNPLGPEAPAILHLAQSEGPDLAVLLHSHENAPALLRPAYVPMETQSLVRTLAERFYDRLHQYNLPHGQPFDPQPERGPHPASLNLTSALYHICGATTCTFECPHGTLGEQACHVSLEQILDIQLLLYETVIQFALGQSQEIPTHVAVPSRYQ